MQRINQSASNTLLLFHGNAGKERQRENFVGRRLGLRKCTFPISEKGKCTLEVDRHWIVDPDIDSSTSHGFEDAISIGDTDYVEMPDVHVALVDRRKPDLVMRRQKLLVTLRRIRSQFIPGVQPLQFCGENDRL